MSHFKVDYLDTEAGYVAQNNVHNLRKLVKEKFDYTSKSCPSIKSIAEDYLKYALGPAYMFEHIAKVEGIKSDLLSSKNEENLLRLAESNEKFDLSKLSMNLQKTLERIYSDLIAGDLGKVSDINLHDILMLEPNLIHRNDIKNYLYELTNMVKAIQHRNDIIVENILRRPGNHLILIGYLHVKDISIKLSQRCSEF